MSKKSNVKAMLETVETVFKAASFALDEMEDGDRVQLSALAEAVSVATNLSLQTVAPLTNHFAHHTSEGYVSRGKHGGLVKGEKNTSVSKPRKSSKKATSIEAESMTSTEVVAAE